jgi:hypothetical protein
MLSRLAGLETEYAIRFRPAPGTEKPGHELVFEAITDAISAMVDTLPGRGRIGQPQVFSSNGGSFCYEYLPTHPHEGLFEAATPECRGPSQLLLYQRAQERLLLQAIPLARDALAAQGFMGSLGLIRNARDAEGNTYGPQENYEVEAPKGINGIAFRGVVLAVMPLMAVATICTWAVALALIIATLSMLLVGSLFHRIYRFALRRHETFSDWLSAHQKMFYSGFAWFEIMTQSVLIAPAVIPLAWAIRRFAFGHIREQLTAFLVSRPIFSGTGVLDHRFDFQLSEKALGITRLNRRALSLSGHSIFDCGNLLKCLMKMAMGDFWAVKQLLQPRLRLQIGLADANRMDVAEFLKLGSTLLVLDMIETGFLTHPPKVSNAVDALHAICADPDLEVAVYMADGDYQTALEIQTWYLQQASQFIARSPTVSVEAQQVVDLWTQVLATLKSEPEQLVGQIDWVTKSYLLKNAADDLTMGAQKKIDIRYHELGTGYACRFKKKGLSHELLDEFDLIEAIIDPPQNTPARIRGDLVRTLSKESAAWIDWTSVRLRKKGRGRIVALNDYRNH